MISPSSCAIVILALGLTAIAAPPGLTTGIHVAGDINANTGPTVNRIGPFIGPDTVNDRREYEYTYNSKDFAKEYGYDGKHHKHPEHKSDEMIKAEAEGLVQT